MMKVYLIASITDETRTVVPQRIVTEKLFAEKWILLRANSWSTGYNNWQLIEKHITKLVTNKNRRGEWVSWFIIEYDTDSRHCIYEDFERLSIGCYPIEVKSEVTQEDV